MNESDVLEFMNNRKEQRITLAENNLVFDFIRGASRFAVVDGDEKYYIRLANGSIIVTDGKGDPVDTTGKDRPGCSNRYCYNWADECEKHDNSRLLEQ